MRTNFYFFYKKVLTKMKKIYKIETTKKRTMIRKMKIQIRSDRYE